MLVASREVSATARGRVSELPAAGRAPDTVVVSRVDWFVVITVVIDAEKRVTPQRSRAARAGARSIESSVAGLLRSVSGQCSGQSGILPVCIVVASQARLEGAPRMISKLRAFRCDPIGANWPEKIRPQVVAAR